MTDIPAISLNNSVSIPQLGFGVFQIPPEDTRHAVLRALEAGYRHIDTAEMYRNEQGVGEAVAESGLPRAEVFVTTKLSNAFHTRDSALHAFDASLKALDFDYVDLFLIHWPLPRIGDFVEAWKALEEIYASGRARAIGVSNFNPQHLQRVFDEAEVVPAVNQIEVHPYLAQTDLLAFNAAHGIATEAWSPIAQGKILTDPTLKGVANRHGKTPAQIALRWHIQLGNIVFPKTVTPARLAENFDLFDFELDTEEVATITALDRKERTGADPEAFHYIPE